MPHLWKALFQASTKFSCQIIATTHSYECVRSLFEAASSLPSPDYSYIRLDSQKGKMLPKSFNPELLEVAMKSEMEIR